MKKPGKRDRSLPFAERVIEKRHESFEVSNMVSSSILTQVCDSNFREQIFVLFKVFQQRLFCIVFPVCVLQPFIGLPPAFDDLLSLFVAPGVQNKKLVGCQQLSKNVSVVS